MLQKKRTNKRPSQIGQKDLSAAAYKKKVRAKRGMRRREDGGDEARVRISGSVIFACRLQVKRAKGVSRRCTKKNGLLFPIREMEVRRVRAAAAGKLVLLPLAHLSDASTSRPLHQSA